MNYPALKNLQLDQEVILRISGLDYPTCFATIEEANANYRFECVIVHNALGFSEKIEVATVGDCPIHLMKLIRTRLRGWQMHSEVPARLIWQSDV